MKWYEKYEHVTIWKPSVTSLHHNNLVQASKEHVLKEVNKFDVKKRGSIVKYILYSLN